jgi:hypothetical protein
MLLVASVVNAASTRVMSSPPQQPCSEDIRRAARFRKWLLERLAEDRADCAEIPAEFREVTDAGR